MVEPSSCCRQYQLIFMDISMPVMDGYESTQKIRELERRFLIPDADKAYIIGLTAHSTDIYKEKCFEAGMNEFSKWDSYVNMFVK